MPDGRSLLTSTMNTRDLGGLPVASGKHTCFGRFVRSDLPATLTDAELTTLRGRGITTVLDLRSDRELQRTASFLRGREGFAYRHLPLPGDGAVPKTETDIPASYLYMLQDPAAIYPIMKILADADTGVLFHCTAGKDRTGVLSALLLSLAGVPAPDILTDYQISYTNFRPLVETLRTEDPTLPDWVGQSKPEYLSAFLAAFAAEYKSVENYLRHIGLTKRDIGRLRGKLLCP